MKQIDLDQMIEQYHINLFYSGEDECWVANAPDCQYCSAFGDTPEEAAREIRIALSGWLEVWMERHDAPPPALYHPAPAELAA